MAGAHRLEPRAIAYLVGALLAIVADVVVLVYALEHPSSPLVLWALVYWGLGHAGSTIWRIVTIRDRYPLHRAPVSA